MSNSNFFKTLRVDPKETAYLDRQTASNGDIAYDKEVKTLRVFDGTTKGGAALSRADLANVSETDFVSLATSSGLFGPNIHIHNTVVNSNQLSGDKDYVTFTVGTNNITALYLTKYVGVDLKAFFAIQEGDAWTVGQDVNQMLTYGHLGPWDPSLAVGSNVLAGNPLHPGAATLAANTTYTVWIQQTGSNITEYALSTNPYWVPATADLPADYSSDPATPTILYQDGAGTGAGGVSVEDSVPTTTDSGSLWLDTNTGILYVYYDDGTSGQWIQPTFPYPDVTNLATVSSLSAVATSGNYSDLVNTPSQFELSVAADDSTQISISSGETIRFVGADGVTTTSDPDGTITITGSGTTGNVTFSTTTIDSTDSSAIIFTPAVVMQSDLTVENDLTVSNSLTLGLALPVASGGTGSSTGNLGSCTADGTNPVGYRNIPNSGAKTTAYTLVATDVGKFIELGTGGSVVVPASIFAAGDIISIFNNTSGSISCACSDITDFYKGGTNSDISSFSVTTRGVATILFITATRAVVTGNLV